MKIRKKEWTQILPQSLETVWDFFAQPDNLSKLTPSEVGFEMLSNLNGQVVFPGMIIEHRVRPILGIPLYWVTEIKYVVHQQYFIDEQRFGPYAFWQHQHHFEQTSAGVLMTDRLYYKVPFGIFGSIADAVFVASTIDQIFAYRQKALIEYFQK